jgi:hypothetical protein
MSDTTAESFNEPAPDLDVATEQESPVMPVQPLSDADRRWSRLNDAGNAVASATARARQSAVPSVQNAVSKAGAKTGPLVQRAQGYRAHIIAAVAAVAVVVAVVLRRRAGRTVTDETAVDLGDWHVIAESTRTDDSV